MNHRLPFFWRFHRTHHSDPKMDVTTAHRFHFGEIIFSSLFRVPIILLLGLRLEELVVYETAMFVIVQLHHANVGLPAQLDRLLRLLIVTPASASLLCQDVNSSASVAVVIGLGRCTW